uniref:N-acetylgalactosaminide beta-1,3-galactosyltransferase n=1 Tax=Anopheles maculatus TaxID=74869 RepID=A0A182SMC3_9DIPT
MSSVADPTIDSIALPVEEGRESLWNKTREAFRYIYAHHLEEYDWFFKADDDTYVVVENLRYFLYPYSPELPIYFGSKFRFPDYVKQGYFSGGAGYVLSREALRRFYEQALQDEVNCSTAYDTEDLEMGKCMESVNVTAGDSRDDLGRKRFLPMDPIFHLAEPNDPSFWYNDYSYYKPFYGRNCCSDLAISFHYIEGSHMYMMDYLIYDLKTWGSNYQYPPLSKAKTLEEISRDDNSPYKFNTYLNIPQYPLAVSKVCSGGTTRSSSLGSCDKHPSAASKLGSPGPTGSGSSLAVSGVPGGATRN